MLPGSVHRTKTAHPHGGPMEEERDSDPEPMLDLDHDVSPSIPIAEQMSDMVVDALVLAGVREHDARDIACKELHSLKCMAEGRS